MYSTVSASTTAFIYDGNNLILETINYPSGSLDEIEYVWGKILLAVRINSDWYFPFHDHNKNITDYVSSTGAIVAHYDYDAFGNTIAQTGPMAHVFRFRFSTQYYDSETGLYYYGRRFYNPALERWLNRDPIEEDGGLNLYAFCNNNPVNNWDYLGYGVYVIGSTPPPYLNKLDPNTWNIMTSSWVERNSIIARARLTITGARVRGWHDAADHLNHFLGGSGSKYTIRFSLMNQESASARRHLISELNDALEAAEKFLQNKNDINIVTITENSAANVEGNWLYAVGLYRTWAKANAKQKNDECYSMTWSFSFRDNYDWDLNNGLGGGFVSDREMALLHRYGRAREFEMVGEHIIKIDWKIGERFDTGADISGDETRRPMRRRNRR